MNPQDNPLYPNKNNSDSNSTNGPATGAVPQAQPFGASPPPQPPSDPMADVQGQGAPLKAPPIGVLPDTSSTGFGAGEPKAMPLHAPPLDSPSQSPPQADGNPLFGGASGDGQNQPSQSSQPSQPIQAVEDDDDEAGIGLVVPQVASDSDLIEKEWVEKIKELVGSIKDDPHKLANEINKMKAAYLKKRYQKEIKVPKD